MAPKKKKNLGVGVTSGRKRKNGPAKICSEDTDSTNDAPGRSSPAPRSPTPPTPPPPASTSASTSTSKPRVVGTLTEVGGQQKKAKVAAPSTAGRDNRTSDSDGPSELLSTQASTTTRRVLDSDASEEGGGGGDPADKSKILLTEEQTQSLIEFVQSNPALWQRDHANFKKEKEKFFIWQAGLKYLKIYKNVENIKAAWTNIRDTYTKMVREKNKSGSGDFQPKGNKRILIWTHANFLYSNVCNTKLSSTVPLKRRREPVTMSDLDDDIPLVDSNPNSQSGPLHLPHQQPPSRPDSSASAGTSGARAGGNVGGGGGGGGGFEISQAFLESLIKDRDTQFESLNQLLKRLPSVCCEDGTIVAFCNWLSSILLAIPQPQRAIVQGQISQYALSMIPTGNTNVPSIGDYLQNQCQSLPPPPNYQPPLHQQQQQQQQQQQPPVQQQYHQQHQQQHQAQFDQTFPQQLQQRGRSASVPTDFYQQPPPVMRPPPPPTRMPRTPRPGTSQEPLYQHMPASGWAYRAPPPATSTLAVYQSQNVDNYIQYSNLASDSAGRTVDLIQASPSVEGVVATTSSGSPALNTPLNISLCSNPPSVSSDVSLNTLCTQFGLNVPPMSTSSVKSPEADALGETAQVVSGALESKNSD